MKVPKKGKRKPEQDWEPGIVEVKFKETAKPRMEKDVGSMADLRLKSKKAKSAIESKLKQFQVVRVERGVTPSSPKEQRDFYVKHKKRGLDVEDLSLYTTFVFPPDTDFLTVSKELEELEFVEKASPRTRAIPANLVACHGKPIIPFAREPLVGRRDRVYMVDTVDMLENQWYIYRCMIDLAWHLSDGRNISVADIDWGYRLTHQDLRPNVDAAHTYNSYDGSNNVSVGGSVHHGTAVAGIAAGALNGRGMLGVAPRCRLWPIQGNTGTGIPIGGDSWANGIDYVRINGGRVAILEVQTGTFGNYEMNLIVNAAIRNAVAAGVVVCVAAGNGNRDAGTSDANAPITYTGSIVVGATAYSPDSDPRAWFSNHGPRVDVAAPGDSNHDLTAGHTADDSYRNGFGGTSGATPKVAGVAALMLALNPALTPEEVRSSIKLSARPNVTDRPIGGLLDAHEAVKLAMKWGRENRWSRGNPCGGDPQ